MLRTARNIPSQRTRSADNPGRAFPARLGALLQSKSKMHPLKAAVLLVALGSGTLSVGVNVTDQNRSSKASTKAICWLTRFYTSGSATSPAAEMDMADDPNPDTELWAALGYRIVRSCAIAQIRLENEIRLVGPPADPASKAKLTLILKAGERVERVDIPYNGCFRPEDNFAVGKKFGRAFPDIMVKIDPTFKARMLEYMRKHPEQNPNRL